jgi:nucleoporin NUP82
MVLQVLETPEIQYEVTQLALNPSGRLLAVTGKQKVTVVVLPRSGFSKRGKGPLECKYVHQISSLFFNLTM